MSGCQTVLLRVFVPWDVEFNESLKQPISIIDMSSSDTRFWWFLIMIRIDLFDLRLRILMWDGGLGESNFLTVVRGQLSKRHRA